MLKPGSAPSSSARAPLLQAIGITKLYGSFAANSAVDLDLFPGEIHALLGENGAGKSTLVKIMYGLIQPTAGEIRWLGEKIMDFLDEQGMLTWNAKPIYKLAHLI